ncbi:MAG: hypothetical protein KKI15_02950 [Proteobacteria bacterium]|nr:hypothetical protein [Pseudomonadota bacterium]MBU1417423.1 hypothetical protein [Pseudomonadota bacterium]
MNPLKTVILSLLFIFLTGTTTVAATQQKSITMSLPDSVLKEVIRKILPLDFGVQSETLLGSVSIDKIDKLKLLENKVSSHITLSGHKLNLVTNIAGHAIRMKIGTLTLSFQCDATIRFDVPTQTLYLRPVITEVQSADSNKADVAAALALLFNNREFPIAIEKLQPIMADTGSKMLNISMHIANVQLHPNILQLDITPRIITTSKVSGN